MSALEEYLAAKAKLRPVQSSGRISSIRPGDHYCDGELSAKSRSSVSRGSARARSRRMANASFTDASYELQDVSFAGSVSSCFAATLRPESRAIGPIGVASRYGWNGTTAGRQSLSNSDAMPSLVAEKSGSFGRPSGRPGIIFSQEIKAAASTKTPCLSTAHLISIVERQLPAAHFDSGDPIDDMSARSSTPTPSKTVVPPMPRWNYSMHVEASDADHDNDQNDRPMDSGQIPHSAPRRISQGSRGSEDRDSILESCIHAVPDFPTRHPETTADNSGHDKLAEIAYQLNRVFHLQQRMLANPPCGRVASPTRANIDDNRMSAVQDFMVALDEKVSVGSAAILAQLVDVRDSISTTLEQVHSAFKAVEENNRTSVTKSQSVMQKRVELVVHSFEKMSKIVQDLDRKLHVIQTSVEKSDAAYQAKEKALASFIEKKMEEVARRIEKSVNWKISREPQNNSSVDIMMGMLAELCSKLDSLSARIEANVAETTGQLLGAVQKRADEHQATQAALQQVLMETIKRSDFDSHGFRGFLTAAVDDRLSVMEASLRTWITSEASKCLQSRFDSDRTVQAAAQTRQEALDNLASTCQQIQQTLQQITSSSASVRWQSPSPDSSPAASPSCERGAVANKIHSAVVHSQEKIAALDSSLLRIHDLLADFRDRMLVNMRAEQGGNLCIQSRLSDVQRACERMMQAQERLIAQMQAEHKQELPLENRRLRQQLEKAENDLEALREGLTAEQQCMQGNMVQGKPVDFTSSEVEDLEVKDPLDKPLDQLQVDARVDAPGCKDGAKAVEKPQGIRSPSPQKKNRVGRTSSKIPLNILGPQSVSPLYHLYGFGKRRPSR